MTRTLLAVLTPPGQAAIAVIRLVGPDAGPIACQLFQTPTGRPLPALPTPPTLRFGRLAGDEIILAVKTPHDIEIHCHGGPRIIDAIVGQIAQLGATHVSWKDLPTTFADPAAAALLPYARTLRTAAILLDQAHGAYQRAVNDPNAVQRLRRYASVGRHLVEPWQVVVAGQPNVGKSSLVNALAGFTRSVVSPIPGTTRDVVAVAIALDGWPIDLIDTAGLRATPDELESEGIERARSAVQTCDLCLFVTDIREPLPKPESIAAELGIDIERLLMVANKIDLLPSGRCARGISAKTGEGLADLSAAVVARLVPNPPHPGDPVPYTPELCRRWSETTP